MSTIERTAAGALLHATRATLVVDVVESVRLVEEDEDSFVHRWLALTDSIETTILPGFAGRLVKRLGDGLMVEFRDVRGAISAAFAIHARAVAENADVAPARRIHLRAGVEAGEIIVDRHDIYGRAVNRAARLAALAGPGETVVSAHVREQLTQDLDADVDDIGDCYLKHIVEPVRAYRLRPPGPRPVFAFGVPLGDLRTLIAIVPFACRDAHSDHGGLGEVVADRLIGELARSPGVYVLSRLSTREFRARTLDPGAVRRHLNARYIVAGAFEVGASDVRFEIDLVDARSNEVMFRRPVVVSLPDLLAGGEAMTDELAQAVSMAVTSRELRRARTQPLPTLQGHTLLLGAITLMHRLSLADFAEARTLLEALVDRAPRQAAPLAWMAQWHVLRNQQGWSISPAQDAAIALDYSRRALDADPSCSLALVVAGSVHTNLLRRLDVAMERYDEAIRSDPSNPFAWLLLGTLQAFTDQGQQAVASTRRAFELTPLDPHRFFYDSLTATAYLSAGLYEPALASAERSLRSNRTHTSTYRAKAIALWNLDRREEARETAAQLMTLEPSLTVRGWRERSPSADYEIGERWAADLRQVGVPQ